MKQGLAALAFLASLSASALEPVLFGPEFTFMPDYSLSVSDMRAQLKKHLIFNQPKSARFRFFQNGLREHLLSPNGWWLESYLDSKGVEVLTKPMTVEQFKQFKDDMQDAIFVTAANAGHFPAVWQGGGHINIDIKNFVRNPILFRNFIVDLLNHNELFMGVFECNLYHNSQPHELYSVTDIPKALRLIDNAIGHRAFSFETVLEAFKGHLFGRSFIFSKMHENRLEIRAVRPQASMDVWIRQIDLLQSRMEFLEKIKEPIPYQPRVPWNYRPGISPQDTPPVDPQAALQSFYVYVTESGQKWQDHTDYLWPQWIADGEVKKFEESQWFKDRESARGCAVLLKTGSDR
jgi:hypothetical protein